MTDPRIEAAARALYKQEARESGSPDPWPSWEDEGNAAREIFRTHATAALAAADAANVITTQEQLAATPAGTVLIDSYRAHLGGDVYRKAMELNGRGELIPAYWQAGPQGVFTNIKLPARVLHWGTP